MAHQRHGFSLVELAIVLVIIGLLAGGILAGQSMLTASRHNRILVDANTYRTALSQFQVTYAYPPGDFPTATKVWGRADGDANIDANCGNPRSDASVGSPTCNGNGNGVIDIADGTWSESFRAWQQLSAAELIQGSYTGVWSSAVDMIHSTPGLNIPAGPLAKSGFTWNSNIYEQAYTLTNYFEGDYRNALFFGKEVVASWVRGGALKARDANKLDDKADDSKPGSGAIRTFTNSWVDTNIAPTVQCATTDLASTAVYDLASSDEACVLIFTDQYARQTAVN